MTSAESAAANCFLGGVFLAVKVIVSPNIVFCATVTGFIFLGRLFSGIRAPLSFWRANVVLSIACYWVAAVVSYLG